MSLPTFFWRYYDLVQREISRLKESEDESFMMPQQSAAAPVSIPDEVRKSTGAIDALKEETQRYCSKNCRRCKSSDPQNCEFFYAVVVFCDELFIRAFDLKDAILEKHYFNTAQGGYLLSRKMEELSKKLDWSSEERELAYVYFYMLMLGFQAAAQGEYAEKRRAVLHALESKLPEVGRPKDNLTPLVYNSIKKGQGRMNTLPSLKATIVWAACALVGVLVVFNVVWSLCTAKIQGNLSYIDAKIAEGNPGTPR